MRLRPHLQHSKAHSARQQLDSQLNENKMVKEVMDTLGDADNVFKLIGPALIRQDVSEAKQVRRNTRCTCFDAKVNNRAKMQILKHFQGSFPSFGRLGNGLYISRT